MAIAVSTQCRAIVTSLKTTISLLQSSSHEKSRVSHGQVNDELERFGLWMGNIGAIHISESPLSLESRLSEADDVLRHISDLLEDFQEVSGELSGKREAEQASSLDVEEAVSEQYEEVELFKEVEACMTRLFRVSTLIRQAAPSDLFAKAISRHRYDFNDQFDIAHVGEKYSKLALDEHSWLRKRLGRAITLRRHYLSYIQDHREKLEGRSLDAETQKPGIPKLAPAKTQLLIRDLQLDSSSRPSTFFTKASSIVPGQITSQMLTAYEEMDPEEDARSYTTISRSVSGDLDSSASSKIPKLEDIRGASKREFECPFCFRMKNIKSEKVWRRHVLSDLRAYVCTFPNCDAPYFSDINEWFRHEMQNHRSRYVCQLCQGSEYLLKENYLAHVRKRHAFILENADEQAALEISQRPVAQMRPQQCPCCSDWIERLEQRAELVEASPGETIYVNPTVFKRHLASHLEQLALFAIPVGTTGDDIATNDAVEDDRKTQVTKSELSALSFDGVRQPDLLVMDGSKVKDEASTVNIKRLNDAVQMARMALKAPVVSETKYEDLARALEHRFQSMSKSEDLEEAISLVQPLVEASYRKDSFMWIVRWYDRLSKSLVESLKVEGRMEAVTRIVAMAKSTYSEAEHLSKVHLMGSSEKTMIFAMGGLGEIYRLQGEHQNAKDMYGRALKLFEEIYGGLEEMEELSDDMVSFVFDIIDRALSIYDLDDSAETMKFLEQAINIQPAIPRGGHVTLRPLKVRLASIYRRQSYLKEFEELQAQLIRDDDTLFADNCVDTRNLMKELAVFYEEQKRWDDAEKLWVEVLDMIKASTEHQEIIIVKGHLAKCYEHQDSWRAAERLLIEALDLSKTHFASDDKITVQARESLATLYMSNSCWQEAEELLKQGVEIRTQAIWSEHRDTIRALSRLMEVYQAQGYWGEVTELCKKISERHSSFHGSEHPTTLLGRCYLTFLYLCLGKFNMAQGLGSMVLETQTRVLGEQHPDTLITTKYLALASACLGQFDRAKEMWTTSISIRTIASRQLLMRLVIIADVYHSEENFKSEAFLREKIRFIEYLVSWNAEEEWRWDEVRGEPPKTPEPDVST